MQPEDEKTTIDQISPDNQFGQNYNPPTNTAFNDMQQINDPQIQANTGPLPELPKNNNTPTKDPKKRIKLLIIIISAVVILVIAGLLLYFFMFSNNTKSNVDKPVADTNSVVSQSDIVDTGGPIKYLVIEGHRVDFPRTIGSLVNQLKPYASSIQFGGDIIDVISNKSSGAEDLFNNTKTVDPDDESIADMLIATINNKTYNFTITSKNDTKNVEKLSDCKIMYLSLFPGSSKDYNISIAVDNDVFPLETLSSEKVIELFGSNYVENNPINYSYNYDYSLPNLSYYSFGFNTDKSGVYMIWIIYKL